MLDPILATPLTVLLIEDSPGDARLVRETLTARDPVGFTVEHADGLRGGLERLRAGGIDIVLLDLALPDSTGIATLHQVREQAPTLPIIVLTGSDDDALAIATVRHGAQDYLVKGLVDGGLLARAIRSAVERKRADDRILWLTTAVEQNPEAVLITDTAGKIGYVNERFTVLTGYTPDDVLGKTPAILKSGHTPPETYQSLWDTITKGGEWRGEIQNRRKNGEPHWVEAHISPIRNAAGAVTHFLAVQQDVTARREAEAEIRRVNASLERGVADRTSELEAINHELESFTYSVSHDLRAPLRQVDGFVRILEEQLRGQVDAKTQHYLQRIHEGAEYMGRLVDDLLTLARVSRSTPSYRRTALAPLVQRVIAELAPDYAGRVVVWRVDALPEVECDPGLMHAALTNLLSNAVKYTRPRPEAVIAIGLAQIAGEAALFVKDNGVGFDMKHSDKLFGVFQRLHRAEDFEGTGVGLATVQRIVRKHGGRIWAEAAPDSGCTFYFTLASLRNGA